MKSYMELVRSKSRYQDLGETMTRKRDDRYQNTFGAAFDRALPYTDAPLEPFFNSTEVPDDRVSSMGLSQKSLENLFEIPSWTLIEDCQIHAQNKMPPYARLKTWVRSMFGEM